MSYVKNFPDYKIKVEVHPRGAWMLIENDGHIPADSPHKKYCSASGFAHAPNTIEKLLGVTWQDKLAAKEKELFKELLEKDEANNSPTLKAEIEKFLNS